MSETLRPQRPSIPERFLRLVRKQWPIGAVLTVFLGGFAAGTAWPQHWLRAVGLMCLALALGAGLRWVLSNEQAGWLAVRAKWIDIVLYASLSVGTFTLGVLVHR